MQQLDSTVSNVTLIGYPSFSNFCMSLKDLDVIAWIYFSLHRLK